MRKILQRPRVGPALRELVSGTAERRTNVALLVLLAGALGSGTVLFALGTRWALLALIVHGVVALGIVLTTPWKWRIVRRGLDVRATRSTWPSVLLGALVVVTVATGVLHSSGLVLRYGPFDDMQVHVVAALATVPLTIWHVVARGNLPQRRDLSRRNVLRAGLVLGTAGALLGTLEGAYRLTGLPGSRRRSTGSYEQASHRPAAMPSIIWLLDPRLEIAASDWTLEVIDGRGRRRWSHHDIAGFDDRVTATIDCTAGWFAEQDWHGVRLTRLIEVPDGARSVVVVSQTGYRRRFPVADVAHLLLATGYEGQPLAQRHGFPARLVAPGRRGFWWVKWVVSIEVSDVAWWRQPAFPLQ
ncbi:MAG: molybdopterin-dependent oxidoreductase [Actinobacteria bacterium]|nr:molybdopterin-dependent oxidoreductase [Actinomycetota bacterium]